MENATPLFITVLEYIASIAGVITVVLNARLKVSGFIIGLFNTIIYIYINVYVGLYASAVLNLYYTVMNILGWVYWTKKDNNQQLVLKVRHATLKESINSGLLIIALWGALMLALYASGKRDYQSLYLDTLLTALAYMGMWLGVKKVIECWYLWLAVNLIGISLYLSKEMYATSLQYLIYLGLAIWGLYKWILEYKQLNKKTNV